MVTFNSAEYSWTNINIVMLGRPIIGIRGVSYTTSQEKEYIYGVGSRPLAIQKGNISYSGEIKLLQSELEALTRAAGKKKDLIDIPPFDITVAYNAQGTIVTDVLKYVEFTEVSKALNQNDKFMEVTLPIIILNIEKNK